MTLLTQDPAVQATPPASGGQGSPTPPVDWRSGLSEDLRNEKAFDSIKGKDWSEAGPLLAKSYLHAQRLVGADKLVLPNDHSTPEEISEFYKKVGRPEKPEDYRFKLPEGLKEDSLDKDRLTLWRKELYEAGMSAKQAERVMSRYIAEEHTARQSAVQAAEKQQTDWVQAIKQEWAGKFDENMNYARLALKDFGSKELIQALEESGFGSHPEVVKSFAQIGRMLADDKARSGTSGSSGDMTSTPENAQAGLNMFNKDERKQKALFSREDPMHETVVKERAALFSAAFPTIPS